MAYIDSVDIRVKGGFPITLGVRVCDAEPDVGIMGPWIDDYWVEGYGSKIVRRQKDVPAFVQRMLDAEDEDEILEQLYEALR